MGDTTSTSNTIAASIMGFETTDDAAYIIFSFNMIGLGLFIGMLLYAVATQRDVPTIRLVDGNVLPDLTLKKDNKFHIFLSHVWSSGQDQVATIKRQLQLLVPGVSVFLDVDDLEDVSQLENYIAQSQLVLVFLSKSYFFSKNCLRELDHALALKKPIVLVHEADLSHGGAPLDVILAECESRGRTAVFDAGGEIYTWQRIAEFQLCVLRQIAGRMLHASPSYSLLEEPPNIYVPGDISMSSFVFERSTCIYVSEYNPGALSMAEELQAAWRTKWGAQGTLEIVRNDGANAFSTRRGRSTRWDEEVQGDSADDNDDHPSVRSPGAVWTRSATRRKRPLPPNTTHFLLYLNKDTFVGRDGQKLAQEVRRVRSSSNIPIVLLHENDPALGGCTFEHFFHTTPEDLISDGIYKKIAIAIQPEPLRAVSLALVAKAFGAQPVEPLLERLAKKPARAIARASLSLANRRSSASASTSRTTSTSTTNTLAARRRRERTEPHQSPSPHPSPHPNKTFPVLGSPGTVSLQVAPSEADDADDEGVPPLPVRGRSDPEKCERTRPSLRRVRSHESAPGRGGSGGASPGSRLGRSLPMRVGEEYGSLCGDEEGQEATTDAKI